MHARIYHMRVKIVCVQYMQGVASVCVPICTRAGVASLCRGLAINSMPDTKSGNSMRSSVPDPDVFGSLDPHPEP